MSKQEVNQADGSTGYLEAQGERNDEHNANGWIEIGGDICHRKHNRNIIKEDLLRD